ncbi:MAG: HNH endonuclease signature motif containing protein [Aquabacterium sp.]|uniref:HNH endonuclease n=1 Tax=Aquabacterium sp. TaxID=1872578 RepID=UPI00271F688E|nr:HNH endonuclease signature motif containing protein [Aquabacterium sp.]MDO9006083.1 HNH endonuclease signature motif containing protein [Aquabacterium sp.]
MNQIKLPRAFQEDLAALRELRANRLKASPTLRACWKFVEQEYRAYELRYRQPVLLGKLKRLTVPSARLLNELYDRRISCFGYIQRLRDSANKILQSCPYCGLPGDLTLDHYLPRSVGLFPHLSVLTANLVPACMPCQRAKGEFYPGFSKALRVRVIPPPATLHKSVLERPARSVFGRRLAGKARLAGQSRVLHPYFDEIFSTRMMRLVDVNGLKVLAASNSFYRKYRLVNFHVSKLRLAERTAREINKALDYFVASLQAHEVTTIGDAHRIAQAELKTAYGANRQGGSIDILVRHVVADDPRLLGELFERSQASPGELTLESQVVALNI